MAYIGNGHGEVAQIKMGISAMEEGGVILPIQIDGLGERFDGRSISLEILRTPPALIGVLRSLPGSLAILSDPSLLGFDGGQRRCARGLFLARFPGAASQLFHCRL